MLQIIIKFVKFLHEKFFRYLIREIRLKMSKSHSDLVKILQSSRLETY